MKRVKVLCIGNALVADDAVGPILFDKLSEKTLPDGVQLRLLGVGGLDLLSEFEGEDLVVVVDATNTQQVPGTLTVKPWQEIEKVDGAPVTSHDIGLDEVMKVGRLLHPELMPNEVWFVGVEGKNFTGVGEPPSPEVSKQFPSVLETIVRIVHGAL